VATSKFFVASLARHIVVLDFRSRSFTFQRKRWNVDLATLDRDVAVANHLARGGTGVSQPRLENDVVEARLKILEHLLAGDTATGGNCLFIDTAKLLFPSNHSNNGISASRSDRDRSRWSCDATWGRGRRDRSCDVQDISSGRKSGFRNGG